jgi:hypothetical protein
MPPETEASKAAAREAMEMHPAVRCLRKQCARLGLPQPTTFDDVDVVEEAIRLAGMK